MGVRTMKRQIVMAIFLLLSAIWSSHVLPNDKTEYCDLSDLRWLAGRWVSPSLPERNIEEWNISSPMTLEGYAKVLDDEVVTHEESLRIVEMSGEIFYLAKVPHNEMPIPFRLFSCKDSKYSFENKNHDFPQRIDYHLVGVGQLTVEVHDGRGNGFSVHYTKKSDYTNPMSR